MTLLDVVIAIVKVLVLLILAPLIALVFTYAERKLLGRIQQRMGPWHVGPMGLFQAPADAIKLLMKESLTPEKAERWIYLIAPFLVFGPTIAVLTGIPFTRELVAANLDLGLLYVLALPAVVIIGFVMAGWGSGNKYALIGTARMVAQAISYELPLLVSVLGVALLANSLDLTVIVEAQASTVWYVVVQPTAFAIFIMAGLAETSRTPFDIAIAESEVMGGPLIEYSGIRWAMFFLAEYVNVFILAALSTVIFLGGWAGPFLPPILWFALKTGFVVTFILWLRATLPRLRIDQLMALCWKVLLPLSLLNLVVVSVQAVYGWLPMIALVPLSVVLAFWFYRRAWTRLVMRPRPPAPRDLPTPATAG